MVGDQGTPVPVELLRFSATAQESEVLLEWQTASEQNTAWFGVERSADGLEFTELARIPAAGNSSTTERYELIDFAPHPNRSYYRLRTIDSDGANQLSKVVSVSFDEQTPIAIGPNPTGSASHLTIRTAVEQPLNFILFNSLGQAVKTTRVVGQVSIALETLPAGIYGFVINRNGTPIRSGKLVVGM